MVILKLYSMKSLAPKVHVHVLPTKNQTSAKEIRDNTLAAIFHLFPPVSFKSYERFCNPQNCRSISQKVQRLNGAVNFVDTHVNGFSDQIKCEIMT